MAINNVKIFPSIGIARLGNSADKYFIGPEIPGNHNPTFNDGDDHNYKDSQFKIKRQAARFRLFGYEEGSNAPKEITLAEANIKWTVELANTKAEWKMFAQRGVGGGVEHPDLPRRNLDVTDRNLLKITPGPRTISEPNQIEKFNTGKFKDKTVPLGEIRTDNEDRLLVLGGSGKSDSPSGRNLDHFADNDDWYDDVSDGPVKALVQIKGTNNWIQASSAWVICAPPKFSPPIEHIVTLYDTLLQVAVDRLNFVMPSRRLSFTKDVYPLLARAMNMKWVSSSASAMHPTLMQMIPVPGSHGPAGSKSDRQGIFNRLRNPNTPPHEHNPGKNMPKIWSDVYDIHNGITLAVTKIQYHIFEQWKDWTGDEIDNDWIGHPVPDTVITPEGLTQAALENCIGGAFYPGIETSYMTRDNYPFIEPFRLDASLLSPGDLTKQMAVPWQSDFNDCGYDTGLQWWPAARPDDVYLTDGSHVKWDREMINSNKDMVDNWYKLGFIVQQGDSYFETQSTIDN